MNTQSDPFFPSLPPKMMRPTSSILAVVILAVSFAPTIAGAADADSQTRDAIHQSADKPILPSIDRPDNKDSERVVLPALLLHTAASMDDMNAIDIDTATLMTHSTDTAVVVSLSNDPYGISRGSKSNPISGDLTPQHALSLRPTAFATAFGNYPINRGNNDGQQIAAQSSPVTPTWQRSYYLGERDDLIRISDGSPNMLCRLGTPNYDAQIVPRQPDLTFKYLTGHKTGRWELSSLC